MNLEKHETEALKRFKEIITEQFGSEIVSIQLFGSKARGDAHPKSNIDILVITRNDDWRLKEKVEKVATEILLDSGVYLSVKVLGQPLQQRLLYVGSSFIRNIQSEGIAI